MGLYKKIPHKIRIILFFIGMILKFIFCVFLIQIYGIYIFPLNYKFINIKISYVFGLIFAFLMYKYWERFIKRKLHYFIMGDNKL